MRDMQGALYSKTQQQMDRSAKLVKVSESGGTWKAVGGLRGALIVRTRGTGGYLELDVTADVSRQDVVARDLRRDIARFKASGSIV
jgi:hypothetical protein